MFKTSFFLMKTSKMLSRFFSYMILGLKYAILLPIECKPFTYNFKNVFFRIFEVFLRGSKIRVFYSIFE
jgi:hypothetical protein